MQFNLVNDQEQVAQFVWRGVAWRGVAWRGVAWRCVALRGVALALGFISILGVCLQRFLACACIICMRGFSGRLLAVLAVSGSFAYFVCACACPRGFAWLSVLCVGARVLSSVIFEWLGDSAARQLTTEPPKKYLFQKWPCIP